MYFVKNTDSYIYNTCDRYLDIKFDVTFRKNPGIHTNLGVTNAPGIIPWLCQCVLLSDALRATMRQVHAGMHENTLLSETRRMNS